MFFHNWTRHTWTLSKSPVLLDSLAIFLPTVTIFDTQAADVVINCFFLLVSFPFPPFLTNIFPFSSFLIIRCSPCQVLLSTIKLQVLLRIKRTVFTFLKSSSFHSHDHVKLAPRDALSLFFISLKVATVVWLSPIPTRRDKASGASSWLPLPSLEMN